MSDALPKKKYRFAPVLRAYVISLMVLRRFFGAEWVDRHIKSEKADPFLRYDDSTADLQVAHELRVVLLAEMLFNFQNHDGFDECVLQMLKGQVESTYAELEIARLVFTHHVPFRFNKKSNVKGQSYDLEVCFPDGLWACADTKCKIQSTKATVATVLNSLGDAKGQLPKERPGIAFMKMGPWLNYPGFMEELEPAIDDYFRTNTRMVSVVFYTVKYEQEQEHISEIMGHHEMSSDKHKFKEHAGRKWFLLPNQEQLGLLDVQKTRWNNLPPKWQRIFRLDGGPMPNHPPSDEEIARLRNLGVKRKQSGE